MNNNMIVITKHDRTVMIDIFRKEISTSAPGNIFPVMKLSKNNTHVLKFNKTSISTCNVEMFTYLLEHDQTIFNAVYAYIHIHGILSDDHKRRSISRPAFYNRFNDNLSAWLVFFESCTHETRQLIIADHICYEHEAKMQGIISLSSYVGHNKYCLARCNNCDNAICKYCYAASLTDMRPGLKNKLIRIHAIFTCVELTIDDIPKLDPAVFPFFRFEAFGDINNIVQMNNYNLFALVNSAINFTLWTKNPGIVQAAINAGMCIVNNLIIGLSSLYLNTPEIDKAKKYSFVRFLFTVYDDQHIKEHNININCGARHCLTCGICYKYLHEHKNGDLFIINERKK